MLKRRIVFFGTRNQELTSRHLERFLMNNANIVAFVEAPIKEVSTTVAKKDSYESIHEAAVRLNIPLYCPKSIKDAEFINMLRELRADVFVVVRFQAYFPKEVLDIPPLGAINFHGSLLPRHAGMHCAFWTLWYGDKETGMTVHYLDEGIDTGDIIYQTKIPVVLGDTVETLYNRIWDSSIPLVDRLLEDLEARSIPRKPQDFSKYHYNYEITEDDFELDFRQPAEVLFSRIRMMPGKFYFMLTNKKYRVHDCTVVSEHVKTRKFRCGIPFSLNGNLVFATPKNFLQITHLTMGNKEVNPLALLTSKPGDIHHPIAN